MDSSSLRRDIRDFLQRIHPVREDIMEDYLVHWQEISFKRKALVTTAGQIERNMYFVCEGFQRSYYVHEGKEHVIAFTYPPSFSGIPESFFAQRPSNYFLECLTDSRFLKISYADHQRMMEEYHALETLFRKGTEMLLSGLVERHYQLLAYGMEDRFRIFVRRSPHLLNQIPHKHLASYLRIDPTNFSKLMGKVRL